MKDSSPIFEVMTLSEAAELYNVNVETLKSRFKNNSNKTKAKIKVWEENGLARKSGTIWLVTKDFMNLEYGHLSKELSKE
ncbi:helix-turn-helix domain-containing protein [Lysinibacillus fusiformis]|uniref:helix-turn-helix domain-containing protein n=1 Tax=Lysinibacillus fusiformis TaxID=28031 RepID=UPI002E23BDC1|nr:helix-turn-helix domain-containing protein [Lysinibacillus fusiformis]